MQLAPRLLLISSLIWTVYCGSQCPPGFKLFQRTPTDKNNHTKEWCLGIVANPNNLARRDYARSLCMSVDTMISIPENKVEADYLLKFLPSNETKIVIDGYMTKKCKIQEHKSGYRLNFAKTSGKCSVENQLFEFDDINSDPTFLKKNHWDYIPMSLSTYKESAYAGGIGDFMECAVLHRQVNKAGKESYLDTGYCSDGKELLTSVVCGTHPV